MLDELERLERAATPGPLDVSFHLGAWRCAPRNDPGMEFCDTGNGPLSIEDAHLIAAARNALPALLRVARAAQQRQICEACGGKGIYWIDVGGEAEAEACDCTVELTEALAALNKETP